MQGNVYDLRGQTDLAVQSYLQAINLGEQDPQLISRAIILLFNQGRFVEADEVVRKLQEQKTPFSSELTRVASEVSLRLENFDRACSLAQSWAEQSGKAEDHVWLAQVYSISGDFAAAETRIPDRHRDRSRSAVGLGFARSDARSPSRYRDSPSGHRGSSRRRCRPRSRPTPSHSAFKRSRIISKPSKATVRRCRRTPQNPSLIRRVAEFFLATDKFSRGRTLLCNSWANRLIPRLATSEADRSWARRTLGLVYGLSGDAKLFDRGRSAAENANLETR